MIDGKNEFDFSAFEAKREKDARKDAQPKRSKKKKRSGLSAGKKTAAAAVCGAVLLALLCFIVYPFLSAAHNPNRLAEEYAKAAAAQDAQRAYELSALAKTGSVSRADFEAVAAKTQEFSALGGLDGGSYMVRHGQTDGEYTAYSVDYASGGEIKTIYLTVERLKDGFWKYDEYAVKPDSSLFCRAWFYTANGAELTVDGQKPLSQTKIETADLLTGGQTEAALFDCGYLLCGKHSVSCSLEGFGELNEDIEIKPGSGAMELRIPLGDESAKLLCETAQQALKNALNNAFNGGAADETLYTERFYGGLDEFAGELKSRAAADGGKLSVSNLELTITECAPAKGEIYIASGGCMGAYINIAFDYTYTLENAVDKTAENRADSGCASVFLVYENGSWQADDIAVREEF